jgi:hypothetical protein
VGGSDRITPVDVVDHLPADLQPAQDTIACPVTFAVGGQRPNVGG